MGSVQWHHLPDCFIAWYLKVGHFFPSIASHDRTACFKSVARYPHPRKRDHYGQPSFSTIIHWKRARKPQGKPKPFGQLTSAHHPGMVANSPQCRAKITISYKKVIINGGQSFMKEMMTDYRGQCQTEVMLWVYSTPNVPAGPLSAAREYLFKPHACCSQPFLCSGRCLEGQWGDKQKRSNTNTSVLVLLITEHYVGIENVYKLPVTCMLNQKG